MERYSIGALRCTLAAALLAACGSGHVANTTIEPVPSKDLVPLEARAHIVPGETLRFELSLRGIVGGETVVATGEPGKRNGRTIVITKSRTETVGLVAAIKAVRDDVVTHLDVGSGAPVYHHADILFGRREAVIESWFDDNRVAVQYRRKGKSERQYRVRLPDTMTVFEGHSIMSALRAWNPSAGERSYFYVLSGRRLWRNEVVAARREEITTPLGRFRALRIEGVATRLRASMTVDRRKKPRKFVVWISDDPERRPLRVTGTTEYGDVKAELVEHHVPTTAITRR